MVILLKLWAVLWKKIALRTSNRGLGYRRAGTPVFHRGAWFVRNDHRAVQNTIYQQVTLHTKDALERLQLAYIKEHLGSLKAFVNTGVTVSVVRDSEGDTTLYFQGRPGVSLFKPRYSSGKYAISVLQ